MISLFLHSTILTLLILYAILFRLHATKDLHEIIIIKIHFHFRLFFSEIYYLTLLIILVADVRISVSDGIE